MRRTTMESAFQDVKITPGQRLTPLHRKLERSMERREKFRRQRKSNRPAK
jgi:hypothetical protein